MEHMYLCIISWLGRIDGIKTFDDDPLVFEQDIVDIRQFFGESDKPEEEVEKEDCKSFLPTIIKRP